MTINATGLSQRNTVRANTALKAAAQFWFLLAVSGQWMFIYYIASFYGGAAAQGNFEVWNKILPHGYTAGDTTGNFALATHLLLATVITLGGSLQLIPQIRLHLPAFHRWNGRLYILTAFIMSLSGLYLSLPGRHHVGDNSQLIAISINAILIMIFAVLALRYAIARKIDIHRRWALRLFLVANGVWFFRVGLMFWIVLNQGPVGFDVQTFTGPFLTFLAFAVYGLLPLTVLELYFRAQKSVQASIKFAMAAGLFVLTLAMGVGIFGATVFMWLPRISI